jgi:hypothetical protein
VLVGRHRQLWAGLLAGWLAARIILNFGEVDCVLMPNLVNLLARALACTSMARWLAGLVNRLALAGWLAGWLTGRIIVNFGEVDRFLVPNLVNWQAGKLAKGLAGWQGWLAAGWPATN